MKKIISVILTTALLLSLVTWLPAVSFADDFPVYGICGENLTWSYDAETTVLTISGTGAMSDYTYDGWFEPNKLYNWETHPWFMYCNDITEVVLESGITHIGDRAFENLYVLEKVIIPDTVSSIGTKAFTYDSALSTLKVDVANPYFDSRGNCNAIIHSNTGTLLFGTKNSFIHSTIQAIADYAFAGTDIESVSIPSLVGVIGESAFENCTSLQSVELRSGLTGICDNAFNGCTSLGNVTFPSTLGYIGYNAFCGCTPIDSVTLPDRLTTLGWGAFAGTSVSSAVIPASVTSIDGAPFTPSTLESITVDENNEFFDSRDNCNALINSSTGELIMGCKNSTIPEGVTKLCSGSFSSCELTSIHIPSTLEYIPEYTFDNALGTVETITVDENNPYLDSRENCNAVISSENNYLVIGCGNTDIPDTVQSIGPGAFSGVDFDYIQLPDGLSYIGIAGFDFNLESVVIPVSLSGFYIFTGGIIGDNLRTIYFRGTEEQWDANLHTNFGTYTVPENVEVIFNFTPGVFTGTYGDNIDWSFDTKTMTLTLSGEGSVTGAEPTEEYPWGEYRDLARHVIIEDGVTEIGGAAFIGYDKLVSVSFPDTLETIGSGAFSHCQSLESVYIPASVTSIEVNAFNGLSSATSVVVDSANPVYDSRDNCNAIIDTESGTLRFGCPATVIPEGVVTIGKYAFSNMEIETLVFSDTVTTVAFGGFQYCTIGTMVLPVSIESFGTASFDVYSSVGTVLYKGDIDDRNKIRFEYGTMNLISAKWIYYYTDEYEYIPGDVNGDTRISAADSRALKYYLAGNTPDTVVDMNADINGDGILSSKDARALKLCIVGRDE